jgi:predicted O-methyltransferase YrrM
MMSLLGARVLARARIARSAFFWLRISFYPRPVRSAFAHWHVHHLELRTVHVTLGFLAGLLKCILATMKVEGNIIELGTYKGGSTVLIAYLLKAVGSNKRIFACDTYRGHPYDDRFTTNVMGKKGVFSDTSVQYVRKEFQRLGVSDKITIVGGLFEDVLEEQLGDECFSLAFIDCDLYESTMSALKFVSSRMTHRGKIVLHDYGDVSWGLTRAVNEWCKKEGRKINFVPVPHIETNGFSAIARALSR